MMLTLQFAKDTQALPQLLAVSLKLMDLLRVNRSLYLFIPKHVHEQLSQADFGRVLYDLLSAEYPELQNRLEIRVHSKAEFLVLTQPPGAHLEIS